MIFILYSCDYEVFLGGNHCREIDVLVEPTQRLLAACEEIEVPMTLFCDVACLWRYLELGHLEFPASVENQLRHAIKRNHDVQLHLHPHWLKTDIEIFSDGSSKYKFDLKDFLLGNWSDFCGLEDFHDFAVSLFSKGRNYLENLLLPEDDSYRCLAYRAGGYGIQPRTKEIFSALMASGIVIDSSVAPGMILDSNVNRIDFSALPTNGNYFVSARNGLREAAENGVFEIPIATADGLYLPKLRRAIDRLHSRATKKPHHRPTGYTIQSTGVKNEAGVPRRLLEKSLALVQNFRRSWYPLEMSADTDLMLDITKRYISSVPQGGDIYFSFSCHSKGIEADFLPAMKKYHRALKKIYGRNLAAISFREAAERLALL